MDYSRKSLLHAAAAGAAGAAICVALCREPVVTRHTIRTKKLKAGQRAKILLLADLHSEPSARRREWLVCRAAAERPDIIALVGDMIDDVRPYTGGIEFMESIAGIAPAFYVTGNHECRNPHVEGIRQAVRDMGIAVLDGAAIPFTTGSGARLVVAGVEDPMRCYEVDVYWRRELRHLDTLRDCSEFKVLLSHRPEYAPEYARSPFDLVLSGHAHGGQLRVPGLINGLFAPNQGWLPPYAGGLYRYGHVWHAVSRGLAVRGWLPRVFNRPELVVLDVRATQ